MQATCSHCQKILEFSGDAPKFCAYCGQSLTLTAPTAEFVLDGSELATATIPPRTGYGDTATVPPLPCDSGAAAERIPDSVGGFKLLRRLGGGGMGTVYEAEDAASGSRVALKLVLPEYAASPDALVRFRQEGKLASSLAHPRCVFVLGADEDQGRPYIVMELMPGHTLDDLVREQGPLTPEQAITKILDVIDGLEEAHRLGLVHRDMKPSNCFLDTDGRVKVGDFGLARSLIGDSKLTRTGTFIGTPLYAAPEQIKQENVDAQSDLYAVAATLYFLLTGKAPFQSSDMMAALARIVSEDPPSMRRLRPELSKGLDRVVLRGLDRDRRRRYRNLEDFRRALLPFLPARPSVVGTGLRYAAYLIDIAIMWPINFSATWLTIFLAIATDLVAATDPQINSMIFGSIVAATLYTTYFGILEGKWGWSVGKRLLRLRVGTAGGNEPPGVRRAVLRALILIGLFNSASVFTILMALAFELDFEMKQSVSKEASLLMGLTGIGNVLLFLLACGLIVCTMRPHNGYRGLHEILSGTRTYRLHWPQPLRRRALHSRPFELAITQPAELPQRVGAYHILGALRWTERERTLLAEDPQLGRKLWLWLRPATEPALDPPRRTINRATRIRWVSCGTHEEWQWDAFLAPAGMPLPALAAREPRLAWTDVRPLLEELTEELLTSCADGTLPHTLSVHQLWVDAGGRFQLLGTPLHGTDSMVDGLITQADQDHAASDAARALGFLRRVAMTALEGRPRAADDTEGPVRAPLPVHAAEMLNRLSDDRDASEAWSRWQTDLEATRHRPTEISRWRRAGHLGLVTAALYFQLMLVLLTLAFLLIRLRASLGQGEDSSGPPNHIGGYVAILLILFSLTAYAFVFRGGLMHWRGVIHLRRADGRKATRWQCALRALVIWAPVALLACLAVAGGTLFPDVPAVPITFSVLALLVLPLHAALALWKPGRSLQDRIAGTYPVPT